MDTETILVKLDGKYAGWEAEMDADPPADVLAGMESKSASQFLDALAPLVLRWNFRAADGTEVPPTREGIGRVRVRALGALVQAYIASFQRLPNPPAGG